MAKYRIGIDKDLQDIVPGYLDNRRRELPELFTFLAGGNLEQLKKAGHRLAGSGGGYGFDRISELGKQLEAQALAGDTAGVAALLEELKDYVENLDIVYE
ncbi:MAG: hypothetical protein A2285_06620 [Elusimicrobia bacterium RIFOXYA12_FULL_57_11]|nr:MAG: hypothetical protein A2285_06620 [Elusimicrobia bacterium RIFOXYA12_FULL_57_11]